jgi:hypothetical protein
VIARTIWSYWHQGVERAPAIVQLCLDSWRQLNPDWRMVVLDQHSLADAVDLSAVGSLTRRDLTVQKVAALARLGLLRAHGGVWADATVFCRAPLDAWLPEYAASGFFAFANPGVDRLMSNWFLAAACDNMLLGGLHQAFTTLWRDDVYWNQHTRAGAFVVRQLSSLLGNNVSTTRVWLSWPVRKLLGVYPYYQFHYTFNRLVLNDPRCRTAWATVKPFSADLPHRLQTYRDRSDAIAAALADIAACESPVYKLDWRVDTATPYWTAVLTQLRATLPVT